MFTEAKKALVKFDCVERTETQDCYQVGNNGFDCKGSFTKIIMGASGMNKKTAEGNWCSACESHVPKFDLTNGCGDTAIGVLR
jgi:hypothetical protein